MADLPDQESNPWGAPDPELAQAAAWLHSHPDLGLGTLKAQATANDQDRASGLTPKDSDWWANKLQRGMLAGTNLLTSLGSNAAAGLVDLAQGTKTGSIGPEGMGVLAQALPIGSKPSGALGMMAGRKASHAAEVAQGVSTNEYARALENRGQQPEQIWKQTGWYRGDDQQWRFEIPDSGAKLKSPPGLPPVHEWPEDSVYHTYVNDGKGAVALGDVLDHPGLFQAYPELEHYPIGHLDSAPGNAMTYPGPDGGATVMAPAPPGQYLTSLLHELQHKIQTTEGFARGSGPAQYLPPEFEHLKQGTRDFVDGLRNEADNQGINSWQIEQHIMAPKTFAPPPNVPQDLLDRYKQAFKYADNLDSMQKEAFSRYQNTAGEVEARNVEERFNNPATYKQFPLADPHMTGFGNPIIVDQGARVPQQYILQPVEHNPWQHEAEPVDYDPFAVDEKPSDLEPK